MKLIPLFLLTGMFVTGGWAGERIPYSPELVQKAEAGDAAAQFDLGLCYLDGKGVKINEQESFEWFTKSANQGNAGAQWGLSLYYTKKGSEGYIATSDNLPRIKEALEMANEWQLKAAEGGNVWAQLSLAGHYYHNPSKGEFRIKDLEKAKEWYIKVQEQKVVRVDKHIKSIELEIQKEQRQLKTNQSR
jgi:TPR repeat protein